MDLKLEKTNAVEVTVIRIKWANWRKFVLMNLTD